MAHLFIDSRWLHRHIRQILLLFDCHHRAFLHAVTLAGSDKFKYAQDYESRRFRRYTKQIETC